MVDWILSWLMPVNTVPKRIKTANIALERLKTPLEASQASKGYIGTPQSPKQAN